MLTQKDFDEIERLIKNTVREEIKHLPTKDEFYAKMDELMGEVQTMREEQTLIAGTLSEHTDKLENHETRITKLEEIPSL